MDPPPNYTPTSRGLQVREYDSFPGILMFDGISVLRYFREQPWARRPRMMLFLRSLIFDNLFFWRLWL